MLRRLAFVALSSCLLVAAGCESGSSGYLPGGPLGSPSTDAASTAADGAALPGGADASRTGLPGALADANRPGLPRADAGVPTTDAGTPRDIVLVVPDSGPHF